jgi:hypothetical protein
MPEAVVTVLAWIAAGFAVYSFSVFVLVLFSFSRWLLVIALANLIYCVLSLGCLAYFREQVTVLGWVYFLGEIAVVMGLVSFERSLVKLLR